MAATILQTINRHSTLFLTGLMGILYAVTFSFVGSVDAYYYFNNIDSGAFEELCHPHHLAYLLLGKGWMLVWQAPGYSGGSFLPLKVMSLLGGLGFLLVFRKLLALFIPRGLAANLLFLAMGCSYLTWHYSTEGEPVIFFQLFSVWILYLLVQWYSDPDPPARLALKMGIVVSLGTLFHQALFLALPLCAVAIIFSGGHGRRVSLLAKLFIPVFFLVAIPYATLGCVATHGFELKEVAAWSTGYLEEFTGVYGSASNLEPRRILRGLVSVFLGGSALKPYIYGGQAYDTWFWLAAMLQVLTLGLLGAGILSLILRWRSLELLQKKRLTAVVAFSLLFVAAAIYWEPASRKFWAPVSPGLILLAGVGFSGLRKIAGKIALPPRAGESIIALLFLLLLVGNLQGGILHKHQAKDRQQNLGVELLKIFQPGDLLVMQADRIWQSVDYNFPQIENAGVFLYVNPEWAAADTTLGYAARSLWETLQSGGTGYVSSDVDERITRHLPVSNDPSSPEIEKRLLFQFMDQEQTHKKSELWSWRLQPSRVSGSDR